MQNQNILSKKSNTIKCIISNKSKFYSGKSKSLNLIHGTQESQTFPRKFFTEKSKSQSCK